MWEKAHVMRQVGIRKTSVTAYEVSKTADDVKTGCEHERGRRGRVGTGSGVCGAVREMEVGWPSGASLRGAASKHRALRPLRRFVVSGTEKARCQRVSWGPGRRRAGRRAELGRRSPIGRKYLPWTCRKM